MQPNPVARGQQGQAPLSPKEIPEVFNPAAPTTRRDSFAGRTEQLAEIVDVVAQRGQHAVVYGERGVGKTSLAVVATGALVERRILALRVNCDGSDDFVSIWRKVVREAQMGRPLPPVVGIRELLTEAVATGDVRDDVAPDELASYCVHSLAGAGSQRSRAAVHRLVSVTLAGLRPPRLSTRPPSPPR